MQGLDWNDLRVVLAVARSRSLAGAARHLRVDESTVGRRISRVERYLGARLFERTHRVCVATQAGHAVITGAERVESLMQRLEADVSGADKLAAGTVRVTTVPMMVNRVLVPALPVLLDEHPQLRVELIAEPRDLSLTRREADLALRLARPTRELGAIARRIGWLDYAVYESAQPGPAQQPWITYEDRLSDLPQCRWVDEQARKANQAVSPFKVNDAEGIINAIQSGLGASLLPIAVGDRVAGIRRRDRDETALSRELWLMTHPDTRDLVRIQVVTDWLVSSVRRTIGSSTRSAVGDTLAVEGTA